MWRAFSKSLQLPYRIVRLCGGDTSFASAMTYDFEVYAAGQDRWLEVSSVSNFETFQSNRLKLRFKDENGKSQLAHTLNGSALAFTANYSGNFGKQSKRRSHSYSWSFAQVLWR